MMEEAGLLLEIHLEASIFIGVACVALLLQIELQLSLCFSLFRSLISMESQASIFEIRLGRSSPSFPSIVSGALFHSQMVKGGKVSSKRKFAARIQSKYKDSDDSDEDYVISDKENEVSDELEED